MSSQKELHSFRVDRALPYAAENRSVNGVSVASYYQDANVTGHDPGALDGTASDREPYRAISIVVHPLFVLLEIVDLFLDEVPILCVVSRVSNRM